MKTAHLAIGLRTSTMLSLPLTGHTWTQSRAETPLVSDRISRLLVVDASVVRAAGRSDNPVSSRTWFFLESVRVICHRVAVNPKIREEWWRHQSRVADGWRRAMYARRK